MRIGTAGDKSINGKIRMMGAAELGRRNEELIILKRMEVTEKEAIYARMGANADEARDGRIRILKRKGAAMNEPEDARIKIPKRMSAAEYEPRDGRVRI